MKYKIDFVKSALLMMLICILQFGFYFLFSYLFTEFVVIRYFSKLTGFLYWLSVLLCFPLNYYLLIFMPSMFIPNMPIWTIFKIELLNFTRVICSVFSLFGMYFYWELIGWPNFIVGLYGICATISFSLLSYLIIELLKIRLFKYFDYLQKRREAFFKNFKA
jgi:hypothetical protein